MDTISHGLSGALVGAACAPTEQALLPMLILGAIAGNAPDLDTLLGSRTRLGMKYHRVALHGIPTIIPQALILYFLSELTMLKNFGAVPVIGTIIAALLTHLLLDYVTSYGTAIFFPFSQKRYSSHSHFIFDPIVLAILISGLFLGWSPIFALPACLIYLLLVAGWRQYLLKRVCQQLLPAGSIANRTSVEPGLLSPWRWLLVTELETGDYAIASISLPTKKPLQWKNIETLNKDLTLIQQASKISNIAPFLAIAHYPRWSWAKDKKERTCLLLEDLKWWSTPPFRPLAFLIPFEKNILIGTAQVQAYAWRGPSKITNGNSINKEDLDP